MVIHKRKHNWDQHLLQKQYIVPLDWQTWAQFKTLLRSLSESGGNTQDYFFFFSRRKIRSRRHKQKSKFSLNLVSLMSRRNNWDIKRILLNSTHQKVCCSDFSPTAFQQRSQKHLTPCSSLPEKRQRSQNELKCFSSIFSKIKSSELCCPHLFYSTVLLLYVNNCLICSCLFLLRRSIWAELDMKHNWAESVLMTSL